MKNIDEKIKLLWKTRELFFIGTQKTEAAD